MYRAPASSSGAAGFLMLIFLLWGALYVSGCTDTPSDLGFDELPPMEDVEIEMATDPDLTAALIEDVSSSMSANMTAAAAVEISMADSLFNEARVELTRGDYERVRSLGDRARDALGRALARGRDRSSLDDATDARDRGDDVTAGKRVIDAHRRTDRSRVRRHDGDPEKGARLVVAMAEKAVELANRLLNGTEISERQQHLLDTAARLAAASAEAFQNGHFRRAIIFGHKAVSMSLMAVIRPDRVTDDRIRALTDVASSEFQVLIDLAEAELKAAKAALELDPNEFFEKLLTRADVPPPAVPLAMLDLKPLAVPGAEAF